MTATKYQYPPTVCEHNLDEQNLDNYIQNLPFETKEHAIAVLLVKSSRLISHPCQGVRIEQRCVTRYDVKKERRIDASGEDELEHHRRLSTRKAPVLFCKGKTTTARLNIHELVKEVTS